MPTHVPLCIHTHTDVYTDAHTFVQKPTIQPHVAFCQITHTMELLNLSQKGLTNLFCGPLQRPSVVMSPSPGPWQGSREAGLDPWLWLNPCRVPGSLSPRG